MVQQTPVPSAPAPIPYTLPTALPASAVETESSNVSESDPAASTDTKTEGPADLPSTSTLVTTLHDMLSCDVSHKDASCATETESPPPELITPELDESYEVCVMNDVNLAIETAARNQAADDQDLDEEEMKRGPDPETGGRMFIIAGINDYSAYSLVDTGAQITLVSKDFWDRNVAGDLPFPELQQSQGIAQALGGHEVKRYGYKDVTIRVGPFNVSDVRVHVVDDFGFDVLLGADALRALDADINMNRASFKIQS